MDHIASLLLGLGNGGVYAALALALVLTYRSSGVINFATGAIALYVAYTYAGLRKGELLVLVPGLPKTVDLGGELGFWPGRPAIALAHRRPGRRAALPAGVPARCGRRRRWPGRSRRSASSSCSRGCWRSARAPTR